MRYLKTVTKTRVELQALQTAGTTIPADVEIRITDPNPGEPDVYRGTGGTVTQAVTQATSASSGGASVSPIPQSFAGTGAVALTQAVHSGRNWHAEPGQTSLTLAAADWPAGGELSVINHTGADLPITLGAGWNGGFVNERDGVSVATGTLVTLPHLARAIIQVKAGGFVNVAVTGAGGGPQYDDWAALTRVKRYEVRRATAAQGEIKVGDLIRSTATRTTRASFDATEAGNWSEVSADPVTSVAGKTGAVSLLKGDVGLGNVDNTSDANKPVSAATQAALDRKAGKAIVKDRDSVTEGLSGRLLHLRSDGLAAGALATWADESGGARDVAQATAASQPAVTAAAIGTKQAVRFDGSADFLSRTAVDLGSNWTIATIVRTGASVSGQIVSDSYPSAVSFTLGINTNVVTGLTNNAILVGTFGGGWVATSATVAATANTTYVITATRTQGGNLVLRVNGQQVGSVAAGTNPTFEAGGTLYIGRRWDTSASPYWNGDVGEVMLFNRVLTADELQLTEGMLAWKYGQQTLLPAAHTYSADPPSVINVPVPVSTMSGATPTTAGLMSAADKTKLDGVASGAEVNVQPDWNQATNTADDFIKNKPTLGTAASKNVAATGNAATGEVVQGSDTRLTDARTPNTHTHAQSDVTNLTADLAAKEATANKGSANGYAGLGADGRVPFAQLPTSVGIGFRLWVPEDLAGVRAIDVNFEGAALGALSTIANTGTLGGTATAAVGEEPTVDAVDATGRRGALFDGTNDSLRSSAIWSLGTTYGLFAVYRRAATGAGMLLSTEYPTNVSYTLGQVQDAVNNGVGGNMVFVGHFNGSWRSHAANSVLANALGVVVGNFDGANLNARIFGTDSTAAQTSLSGAPSGNTRIGRRWDVAGNTYFAGRIFRVIGKVGAFTIAEMQQLEGWAAHRWGTAASLPAAHPYRANPPIVTL